METHPKEKQQDGRNKENQSRKNRSGGKIDRVNGLKGPPLLQNAQESIDGCLLA